MRSIFIFTVALFVVSPASAAEILSGRYVEEKNAVELMVRHLGGCEEHAFLFEVVDCDEGPPVYCPINLTPPSAETCEEVTVEPVLFSLSDWDMDGPYYKGAVLDFGTNSTSVKVTLPQ